MTKTVSLDGRDGKPYRRGGWILGTGHQEVKN